MNPAAQRERKPQQRLKKFVREPDRFADRQLTRKSLEVMAVIERYRFIPTSLLVRVVPGDEKNTHRHLQMLFHRGLVNRFVLPKYGVNGQFIYYLDSLPSLSLLIDNGLVSAEGRPRKEDVISANREKNYAGLYRDTDIQGKLLFLEHELMVSRFHGMLEMACHTPKLSAHVQLEQWKQGPELWNRVEVLKVKFDTSDGRLVELDKTEHIPHRPDAFFTLRFPTNPEGEQVSHFLYEADRGTENTTRFKLKLRAHYHFIVKQHRQKQEPYSVPSIRAVLTETTTAKWQEVLRECAGQQIVSSRPSPLFWFTNSEHFTKPVEHGKRTLPLWLAQPEQIFRRIWASADEDQLRNLAN